MVSLLRRSQSSSAIKLPTHTFAKQQLGVAISLSILFGISWGFGLFASQHAYSEDTKYIRDIFAAVFVVLTSFHGFGLFIMHCVRPTKVRKEIQTIFKLKKVIMTKNNKKQRKKISPPKKNDFFMTSHYDTILNNIFTTETTFMDCENNAQEESNEMHASKCKEFDLSSEH